MGWRRLIHKITGRDMTRLSSFTRDDLAITFLTDTDGETLRHACLLRGTSLVDEVDGDHAAVAARITLWIEEFS